MANQTKHCVECYTTFTHNNQIGHKFQLCLKAYLQHVKIPKLNFFSRLYNLLTAVLFIDHIFKSIILVQDKFVNYSHVLLVGKHRNMCVWGGGFKNNFRHNTHEYKAKPKCLQMKQLTICFGVRALMRSSWQA